MKISVIRLVVLLCFVTFIVVLAFAQLRMKTATQPSNLLTMRLPAEGKELNNTNGQVPGHPHITEVQMKRLFAFLQVFQQQGGKLREKSFMMEVTRHPEMYGLENPRAPGCDNQCFYNRMVKNTSYFVSPDNRFADSEFVRNEAKTCNSYQFYQKRPDGTNICSPKLPETRDVLASTDIYVHENVRLYPHQRSTSNPVGFYMVLWDDGAIEKIPYDKVIYYAVAPHDFHIGFPNQAGLPASALSYDDFYLKEARTKVVPRGGSGQPGRDYKGQTL